MATATSPTAPPESPVVEPATPESAVAPPVAAESSRVGADPYPELFRISLDAYQKMAESGALTPADRVVLLDGLLVRKMTKDPQHSNALLAAQDLLNDRLKPAYHARPETPVALRRGPAGDSAPEPDVTLVRGARRDYRERDPVPADVLLVVEVANSSFREDRRGLARYAWFGVPIVWIINIRALVVEVYSGPSGPGDAPDYATKVTRKVGETLDLTVDDRRIEGLPVAEFFE